MTGNQCGRSSYRKISRRTSKFKEISRISRSCRHPVQTWKFWRIDCSQNALTYSSEHLRFKRWGVWWDMVRIGSWKLKNCVLRGHFLFTCCRMYQLATITSPQTGGKLKLEAVRSAKTQINRQRNTVLIDLHCMDDVSSSNSNICCYAHNSITEKILQQISLTNKNIQLHSMTGTPAQSGTRVEPTH